MGFGSRVKTAAKILMTGSLEEYRSAFIRGDDLDTWTVDAETAMKYSAVNACIRVLAETFASVPIILYQKTNDGRDPSTDLAAYDVLHNRPNEEMAPFNFNETMMTNFCYSGNIVCERPITGQRAGGHTHIRSSYHNRAKPGHKKAGIQNRSGSGKQNTEPEPSASCAESQL
jgi:phage portal protein BeeE